MTPDAFQKSVLPYLVVIAAIGLAAGLASRAVGMPGWATVFWAAATLAALPAEIVTRALPF